MSAIAELQAHANAETPYLSAFKRHGIAQVTLARYIGKSVSQTRNILTGASGTDPGTIQKLDRLLSELQKSEQEATA